MHPETAVLRKSYNLPRMSKKKKEEYMLFLNNYSRITYIPVCLKCQKDCKQSFRAVLLACNKYQKKERWIELFGNARKNRIDSCKKLWKTINTVTAKTPQQTQRNFNCRRNASLISRTENSIKLCRTQKTWGGKKRKKF